MKPQIINFLYDKKYDKLYIKKLEDELMLKKVNAIKMPNLQAIDQH